MTLASPQTRRPAIRWTAAELSARFPDCAAEIATLDAAGVSFVEIDSPLEWITLAVPPEPAPPFVTVPPTVAAWVFLEGLRCVLAGARFAELRVEALR